MSDETPRERLRENATSVASTLVTGFWLAALLTGQEWWLGALIFGYVAVVPLVALLYGDEAARREWWEDWWGDRRESSESTESRERLADGDEVDEDALETLRRRYAAGELTDEQFERKLDLLLDTETLEDVEDRVRSETTLRERE